MLPVVETDLTVIRYLNHNTDCVVPSWKVVDHFDEVVKRRKHGLLTRLAALRKKH